MQARKQETPVQAIPGNIKQFPIERIRKASRRKKAGRLTDIRLLGDYRAIYNHDTPDSALTIYDDEDCIEFDIAEAYDLLQMLQDVFYGDEE